MILSDHYLFAWENNSTEACYVPMLHKIAGLANQSALIGAMVVHGEIGLLKWLYM